MQQLIRISEVFAPHHPEILKRLGIDGAKKLGAEYFLFQHDTSVPAADEPYAIFVGWRMPVHHAWPCNPEKTVDFVEKSCLALERKFSAASPQSILVGPLIAGSPNPHYRKLAAQLRARALQLFAPLPASSDPESQDPARPTLFALLGREGLFCGLASPRECRGFHPGGSKFISRSAAHSISRAGAKIAEALHFIRLDHPPLPEQARWLELGASPGGMTAELLHRGCHVTAVDRAPMDPRIADHERLEFFPENAATFVPPRDASYDALLCDLNGDAHDSLAAVLRLLRCLRDGALIVFTLKTHKLGTLDEIVGLHQSIVHRASTAGLKPVAQTHLTYNRNEFTLFWKK